MGEGFSQTEWAGIAGAIALVLYVLYDANKKDDIYDPYYEYGIYLSARRYLIILALQVLTSLVVVGALVWRYGSNAIVLIFPVGALFAWLGRKYYRGTATIPPRIVSALVFLEPYARKWPPRSLQAVASGKGLFCQIHVTEFNAGLAEDSIYLNFDDRIFVVPLSEVETATVWESEKSALSDLIHAISKGGNRSVMQIEFSAELPFTIHLAWPNEHVGELLKQLNSSGALVSDSAA